MKLMDSRALAYFWEKLRDALDGKQNTLSGNPGQVVGFDEQGGAAAVSAESLGGARATFSVVTALPEAADAEENTLYFVKNGEGLCDIYIRNSVRMTAESLFSEAYGLELAEGQTAAVKLETPGFDINVTVSAGTTVDDVTQKANATAKYYGALFAFDEDSGQIAAHNTGDNSPIEVTVTSGGETLTGRAPCDEMLRLR